MILISLVVAIIISMVVMVLIVSQNVVGWCRASVTCTPKEFVNMDRCFWEERLLGVFIYKTLI
jgi:hypothetical protein